MNQIVTALSFYYTDHGKFPCHAYQNSADPEYLVPLILGGYLTRAPHDPTEDNLTGKYYDYLSFKSSSGGACGAIAHLGFKLKSGAACPGSSTATDIPGHCHIFLYEPLNCSDPYLTNDSMGIPPDCQPLEDGYIDNDW